MTWRELEQEIVKMDDKFKDLNILVCDEVDFVWQAMLGVKYYSSDGPDDRDLLAEKEPYLIINGQ